MTTYRNRTIDASRPVCVHRNLRRGGYSVLQRGRVVAHVEAIMLADAECIVSRAGWRRCVRIGKKTVHAWIRGIITDSGMGTNAVEASGLSRLFYDRRVGEFRGVAGVIIRAARIVALNSTGAFYAYGS